MKREIAVAGVNHRYQVFVPTQRIGGEHPPAILFLHGSGERGSDGEKQIAAGLGPHVRAHADDFPAIVVFPQSPDGMTWTQDAPKKMALAALDAAMREFGGDPDRIYLTGLSLGGYGTWALGLEHKRRFAALVPVCGGVTPLYDEHQQLIEAGLGKPGPYDVVARELGDMPVWIFHGAKDTTVLPADSRGMAAALKSIGAVDARYTEFPDADHNSWDPAYATPELWSWLFAQKRL